MSKYPTTIFPPCSRKSNDSVQQVFTDYGCKEGVDTGLFEEDPAIVNKLRVASLHPRNCIGHGVLEPEFSFMVFGKPESLKTLIDDDIGLDKMLVRRKRMNRHMKPRSEVFHSTSVEDYIFNLSNDHPVAAHGNFLKILKECCFDTYFMTKKIEFQKFCQYIDPMLCSGGMKFLSGIVCEESRSEILKSYFDRDCAGGCLVYKKLERSTSKPAEFGALFCAQSQGLDELSVKIIDIDLHDEHEHEGSQEVVPNLKLSTEFRQSLNGRALQLDVVPFEHKNHFLFATRSDYHVLLSAFRGSQIWNEQESSATNGFDPVSSLCCLKTSGNCKVSSVALSPFISGECVVATGDGIVRLWNADVYNNANGTYVSRLQTLISQEFGENMPFSQWKQVRVGAHPRQIYVADDSQVCLFDIRTGNHIKSMLNMMSSFTKKNEKIYCVESGMDMGNDYECLIATNCSLFLMDQRHCGAPLMHCATNMTVPPRFIKAVSVCNHNKVQTDWRWTNSISAVLVANQSHQEVYCYQLNKTEKSSFSSPSSIRFPHQCIEPPRVLGGFADICSYAKSQPCKLHDYLQIRTSKRIVGLDAFPLLNRSQTPNSERLIVLQMNSVGDIGYQTLKLQNLDAAYETGNGPVNKTSGVFSSMREKEDHKLLFNEVKRKNYDAWIAFVTDVDHTEVTVSKRYIIPHKELRISSRRLSDLLPGGNARESIEQSMVCQICSYQMDNGDVNERKSVMKCAKCGVNINMNASMKKLFNPPGDDHMTHLFWTEDTFCVNNYDDASNSDSEDDLHVISQRLDLLKTNVEESDCDEIGNLLNDTWNGTYEDYWEKQSQHRINQRNAEKQAEDRRMRNLGQDLPLPKSDRLNTNTWRNGDDAVSNISQLNSRKTKDTAVGVDSTAFFNNLFSSKQSDISSAIHNTNSRHMVPDFSPDSFSPRKDDWRMMKLHESPPKEKKCSGRIASLGF